MTLDPARVQLAIGSQVSMDILSYFNCVRVEPTTDAEPEEEELGAASPKRSRTDESEKGSAVTPVSAPTASGSARHVVGYKAEWETEFSWLQAVRDETGLIVGMLCGLCKLHKTKNKYNQSAVWSESPCVSLRKDSVRRHSLSEQHKQAVELDVCREASDSTGGIEQAFQSQIALNRLAVKGAMQCLYWLVKSEVPHTSHYNSLVKAVEFMGCDHLRHLHKGDNEKYTSQRIIQEFLQVTGGQIERDQFESLLSSPFFSIMIDESTDVAVLTEMVIYVRYISPEAEVCTHFLTITELPDGTAETIERTVTTYLEHKGLSIAQIEQLLQTMELKLKKPADTRWLSHDSACQTLVKILPAVITSLEREAEERGQALAVGLCKVVKKYTFIATLYMLCDVLPTISRLSCIFQSSTSALDNLVSSTIESVQLLCSQAGNFARKLD